MILCYLCGEPVDASDVSGDHVIPRTLLGDRPPKVKGFDYGGKVRTHRACNNRFGDETNVRKALQLLGALHDSNTTLTRPAPGHLRGRRRSEGALGFRSTSRVTRWRASSSSSMTTASWLRGSGNDSPGSHAFGSRGRRSWIWSDMTGRLSNEVAPDRERGRVRRSRRWSAGHVRYWSMASGGAGRAGCGGLSHEVETG